MIHLIMYDHALSLFFFLLGWDGEGEGKRKPLLSLMCGQRSAGLISIELSPLPEPHPGGPFFLLGWRASFSAYSMYIHTLVILEAENFTIG